MIQMKRWYRVPSVELLNVLPDLKWQANNNVSPAVEVSALMVYVALTFMAQEGVDEAGEDVVLATASYDELMVATSRSRRLVHDGLKRLVELGLIEPRGSQQKRRYRIVGLLARGWFKLPCQAIVSNGVIRPFKNFTLRSKVELHALKLYIYLAARRDNYSAFSMPSYAAISDATGIPERDVQRASALLVSSGLLAGVMREPTEVTGLNEPYKYFLTGHQHLAKQTSVKFEDAI